MPIFIAPIAGAWSDRIGGQRLMAAGLALQSIGLAWIATVSSPTMPYSDVVAPFFLSGIGMALFFAPVANVVLSSVTPEEEGQASGANNAIRELGGVFGVAVLASIFSRYGGYQTGSSFVHGVSPALYVGAAIVAIGAGAAMFIPRRQCRSPPDRLYPAQAGGRVERPATSSRRRLAGRPVFDRVRRRTAAVHRPRPRPREPRLRRRRDRSSTRRQHRHLPRRPHR